MKHKWQVQIYYIKFTFDTFEEAARFVEVALEAYQMVDEDPCQRFVIQPVRVDDGQNVAEVES
jgi:hypothetical protein